jgi:hypothetical protein
MKYGKYWFAKYFVGTHEKPEKKSVCHAALLDFVGRNLYRRYLNLLNSYFFYLGWIDAPHTHNFEILKSLQKLKSPKNIKTVLIFFKC